jgi:EmrB/QacA subfamily drug resistance transporter
MVTLRLGERRGRQCRDRLDETQATQCEPQGEQVAMRKGADLSGWHAALGRRATSSDRYKWWVLWVALSGLLATNLLFTVFVVALPQVARGFHTSVATVAWVVTGPLLAFGVVAPLAGKAGDIWGHRRLFLFGIALETMVAILSATAPNVGVLIAARTLGGLVGASIGASSMALILSVFEPHERVKALGFWSLVGAGGPVLGVAIGGQLIESFGWRAMFVLQAPLLLAATILSLAVLPERASDHRVRPASGKLQLDWAGAGSIALCVGAFLFALNRGPEWGWASPGVIAAYLICVVAAGVFVRAERRAADPVFPLRYLKRRNFVFPAAAQGCANFAYLGGFFLAPLLLEEVFGYANREGLVGLLVLPRPIVFSAIAPVAGYFAVKVGERTAAIIGTCAIVASMSVFALATTSTGLVLVELALVLSGAGLGICAPSLSASAANEFEAKDLGAASASQQMVSQVGTVAGIQVMLTVQAAALHGRSGQDALLSSFHAAFVVGGVVALLGVFGAAMSRSTNRRRGPAVELSEALDMGERVPVPVAGSEEEGKDDPAPVDPGPEGRTPKDSAPVDPAQTGDEAVDRAASLPWENA